MGFDQKIDLDHIVNFVGFQLDFVDYLHLNDYNQLLFVHHVV